MASPFPFSHSFRLPCFALLAGTHFLVFGPDPAAAQPADVSGLTGPRAEAYQVLRTYLNGWQDRDLDRFEEVLAPDFVDYMYGSLRTREELLEQASAPDLFERIITIDDVLVDGEMAMVRMTTHITHPETGAEVAVVGMIIARIVDGKMIEGWGVHDRLGMLQQLGVVSPGPELQRTLDERFGGAR